jgi:starch synthase
MKIALCASEAVPFAKTGGLADVCGALPQELDALGHEVVLILPKYQSVKGTSRLLKAVNGDVDMTLLGENVRVFFVKHDMFLRAGLYGDAFGDYPDNLKRFSYFCQKSLELFEKIGFIPDVLHCHDWQTALVPLYMKDRGRQFFKRTGKLPATVLTIHNMAYQGIFPKEKMPETDLSWEYFTMSGLEYYDKINLLKGGILHADDLNTVSLTYSREVQTEDFGCGLEGVLAQRKDRFSGIINGVDYKTWNPQGDAMIFKNYTINTLRDKKINKLKLQGVCGFPQDENVFLLGFVGRLVEQKGVELILSIIPECVKAGMQVVLLGIGDPKYEAAAFQYARQYPHNIYFSSRFDDRLAHQIYAGSDAFLMPSRFEPCGIGQLISFKYGSIPVVYKTGGLADTVSDVGADSQKGSGFVFDRFGQKEFFASVAAAQQLFGRQAPWQDLMKRVMRLNFSWKESARKYVALYEKAQRHSRETRG